MASDAERQVLIKAVLDAVRTSTDALQKVAGWGRRGKAGAVLEAISFTAALFLHDDSRPSVHADGSEFADPNVHVHCIILNIAMRSDGTVGAIQSVLLRSAKMLVGAVFHAALAANLARLRLSSDRVGKNGIFEIAGFSVWAIKFFSGRREEVERGLEARGATSAQNPQLASKIAASSRKKKKKSSLKDRLATWHAAALRNNIDFERERRAVEAAFKPIPEQKGEAVYQEPLIELTEGYDKRGGARSSRDPAGAKCGTGRHRPVP